MKVSKHIQDNEVSEEHLKKIMKHGIKYQKVPPKMHHHTTAEKAISNFNNHFKSVLSGVDNMFPIHLSNRLLSQTESTLNMLQLMRFKRTMLTYAYTVRAGSW